MNTKNYNILARKYRPQTFTDLIGQEIMVRTLSNSFQMKRIAQAWILTGTQGVGKTTTARILARALNYQSSNIHEATIKLDQYGDHCQEIIEGRHIDVIEMDAASHTGIDDIREIIEQIHYKPLIARYKIYIIDEVHMLSNQAFNGLLKTLEEPPEHVKFIFATTEIQKVPITILSRCQRFDLRRVDKKILTQHLKNISEKEQIKAQEQALSLIAKFANGSVRDALSLLDQAISYSHGEITIQNIEEMLYLSDYSEILTLFSLLMEGKTKEALESFSIQYNNGADPLQLLKALADINHRILKKQFIKQNSDETLSPEQNEKITDLATKLSLITLSRSWKMLLNAIDEVKSSFSLYEATEMALIRISCAAHLPSLEETQKAFHLMLQNKKDEVAPKISEEKIIEQPVSLLAENSQSRDASSIETSEKNEYIQKILKASSNEAYLLTPDKKG